MLTFFCLFVGHSSYAQEGWDDEDEWDCGELDEVCVGAGCPDFFDDPFFDDPIEAPEPPDVLPDNDFDSPDDTDPLPDVSIQGINTNGPGKDYVPNSTDKLVKPGIVTTCDIQANLPVCVLTSLEVTLNNVLGLTVTAKQIDTAAALSTGSLYFAKNGLTPSQAVTFINSFCVTEALTKTDFKTAIDNGKTFLTDIKTDTIITPDKNFPNDRSKDTTLIVTHSVAVIGL
ncbi:hypothetical protein [Flavobacterium cellulosilyticum]|uniref:Uncharacterized protein n=1 Tax=Flavobacterium cellulosilyticum TaxID=2541731 RepID=A0A4R5CM48_9FLAO|nr:hypothetical protein [Flavobacterium cellulosilyticum]TDD98572.1 hypothetical protein E0F76_05440 [Flavobacterium cellulosilyticum]